MKYPEKVTGREMCDTIARADFLRKPDGTAPSPDEIWNYSPTGELYMVFQWYEEALCVLANKGDGDAGVEAERIEVNHRKFLDELRALQGAKP